MNYLQKKKKTIDLDPHPIFIKQKKKYINDNNGKIKSLTIDIYICGCHAESCKNNVIQS